MKYKILALVIWSLFITHAFAIKACPIIVASIVWENKPDSLLSDIKLTAIRDGFDKRVATAFNGQRGAPLKRARKMPPRKPGRADYVRGYSLSLVEYATRCMWLNEHVDAANAALIELANYYLANHQAIYDIDNFHWHSELLLRLIELFGPKGTTHAGLLRSETEQKIMEIVWIYSKQRGEVPVNGNLIANADYKKSNTWYITESENHHAQSFTTLWHFAKLAKDMPDFKDRLYDDGRKAADHYKDWNAYIKMYLTERSKKGLLVEMMKEHHNTAYLKGFFNIYDFAEDAELKRRTGLFLDLYFTYWGEEQINGVSGGGKARIYTDLAPQPSGLGYYFFGIGPLPAFRAQLLDAMTSTYRPPLVVVDIACDVKGRGAYEVMQRPLGLAEKGQNTPPLYHMRTDSGGIARYSYCTPDFIIGTAMSAAHPATDWSMISSQNRSHGIIFEANQNAGILPECEIEPGSRTAFNTQWSVQKKGTLICQKLKSSQMALHMRVWFAKDGLSTPIEKSGWVFTQTRGAYAAVKVVNGTKKWLDPITKDQGEWLYCDDEYTPVILEVVQKTAYKSFEEFQDKIIKRPLSFKNNILNYTGMYGDDFTFFSDYSKVPRINETPVNYAPSKDFDSPFLKADWNSGIVYIQKGTRKMELDFNQSN